MTSLIYLMELDIADINLALYNKEVGRVRQTKEPINDRAYLMRTEQLYHRNHTSQYVIVVLVEKYIDERKVNAWSWTQEADISEVLEFPSPTRKQKELLKEDERMKLMESLSNLTPEQIKQMREEEKKARKRLTAKLYYQKHKEKVLERSKAWARNNKDKVHASHKRYNQKLRENKLWEDQQKDSSL